MAAESTPAPAAEQISDTVVLRRTFGSNWRWWAWFRAQWSAMSITVVVAGVAALGGWALNLKTRVVVLETQVVPVLKDEGRVDKLEATVAAHGDQLGRLEERMDYATQHAGDAPVPRRQKPK